MLFRNKTSLRYSAAEYTPRPSSPGEEPSESDECAVEAPFPVWVCGVDTSGERFKLQTTLESLSASRLCLRLSRSMEANTRVFALVHLRGGEGQARGPYVALRGCVQHSEPCSDGLFDARVEFTRHWFIYTEGD